MGLQAVRCVLWTGVGAAKARTPLRDSRMNISQKEGLSPSFVELKFSLSHQVHTLSTLARGWERACGQGRVGQPDGSPLGRWHSKVDTGRSHSCRSSFDTQSNLQGLAPSRSKEKPPPTIHTSHPHSLWNRRLLSTMFLINCLINYLG